MYEYRYGRVYEERVPKAARDHDEDFASPYAEARKTSRKFEERHDETPRKPSGRTPDDRRRPSIDDEYYERKEREKQAKVDEAHRRAEKE